jgi:SPP1 family predicted phage head-tail adaptor
MSALLKPPPIGALRRRLILESLDAAPDGGGGALGSWSQVAVLWAALHPRRGGEAFDDGHVEASVHFDIWIRPRADITPGQRLRLNTRVFNIRAVLRPDEFVNRMRLVCEERNL